MQQQSEGSEPSSLMETLVFFGVRFCARRNNPLNVNCWICLTNQHPTTAVADKPLSTDILQTMSAPSCELLPNQQLVYYNAVILKISNAFELRSHSRHSCVNVHTSSHGVLMCSCRSGEADARQWEPTRAMLFSSFLFFHWLVSVSVWNLC